MWTKTMIDTTADENDPKIPKIEDIPLTELLEMRAVLRGAIERLILMSDTEENYAAHASSPVT